MTELSKWLRRLMQLARKVNRGEATKEEAREYDYELMLFITVVCFVGMISCIIVSHVFKSM